MPDTSATADTRSEFIEKVGMITQAEGLPRIAGRVFGLLIFDGDAVSFGDLATRLEVSRGSISNSIRLLEERGLVKRIARPGDRQDYFQLAPRPYLSLLEGVQKRTRLFRDEIAQTIDALPADADATARVREYAAFYASIHAGLAVAVDDLKKEDADKPRLAPEGSKDLEDDH
ncbi:MarR family transcriptional regulator [Sulfitobacter sp. HNIBRBA3233]|uniref:GbsR/MarR family transcriptional regulator n=1 Tax=Sulfitobacter marinivivus TaxID=3158558 RepID=UPI0032E02766